MRATRGVVVVVALLLGFVATVGAAQPGETAGPSATATCGTRAIDSSELYAGYQCALGNAACGTNENIGFNVGTFPYVLQGCEAVTWNFGDFTAGTGLNPIHVYQHEGVYTVHVLVANSIQPPATTSFNIAIVREGTAAPGVDFAWVPFRPLVNTTVTFSAAGQMGAPVSSWAWDFGDGTTGTGKVITHEYLAPGLYNVRVTGQTESGPSTNVRVIRIAGVCSPPVITSQPVSVTVNPAAPAQFDVVADGTGLLRYQWYKGLTGDTSHPVADATGSTLLIPTVTMEGSYWVRVSNDCGEVDSDTVAVTLNGPCVAPVITSQTLSATVDMNRATTLHARAEGMLPIRYRWWAGGVLNPVQMGQDFVTAPLSRSTTFYVVATNPCGSVMSNMIDVRVGPPRRHPVNRPQ